MRRRAAAIALGLLGAIACNARTRVGVDARPPGASGRQISPTVVIDKTPAPYTTPIPEEAPAPVGTPAGKPTPPFLLTPQFAATPDPETTPRAGTEPPTRPTLTP